MGETRGRTPRRGRRFTKPRGRSELESIGEATAAVLGIAVSLDAKLRASDDPAAAMRKCVSALGMRGAHPSRCAVTHTLTTLRCSAFHWAEQTAYGETEAMEPLAGLDLTADEVGLLRELVGREELQSLVRLASVAARGEALPPLDLAALSQSASPSVDADTSAEEDRLSPRHRPLSRGVHIAVSPVPTPRSDGDHSASLEWVADLVSWARHLRVASPGKRHLTHHASVPQGSLAPSERRVWRGEVARKMTKSQHRRREASLEYRESIETAKRDHEMRTSRAARARRSPLAAATSPSATTSPPPIAQRQEPSGLYADASAAASPRAASAAGDEACLPVPEPTFAAGDTPHRIVRTPHEPRRAPSSSRRSSRRATSRSGARSAGLSAATRPVTADTRPGGATGSAALRAGSRPGGPPSRRSDPGRKRVPVTTVPPALSASKGVAGAAASKQALPQGLGRHRTQASAPPHSKRRGEEVGRRPATGTDSSRGNAQAPGTEALPVETLQAEKAETPDGEQTRDSRQPESAGQRGDAPESEAPNSGAAEGGTEAGGAAPTGSSQGGRPLSAHEPAEAAEAEQGEEEEGETAGGPGGEGDSARGGTESEVECEEEAAADGGAPNEPDPDRASGGDAGKAKAPAADGAEVYQEPVQQDAADSTPVGDSPVDAKQPSATAGAPASADATEGTEQGETANA